MFIAQSSIPATIIFMALNDFIFAFSNGKRMQVMCHRNSEASYGIHIASEKVHLRPGNRVFFDVNAEKSICYLGLIQPVPWQFETTGRPLGDDASSMLGKDLKSKKRGPKPKHGEGN